MWRILVNLADKKLPNENVCALIKRITVLYHLTSMQRGASVQIPNSHWIIMLNVPLREREMQLSEHASELALMGS